MFKPIPEDTGSFLKIRTAQPQMLYVDKTAYLHRLVTSGRTCVFLARPRRFGKSLMITTLKEIFNGRKDLFEGLAMDQETAKKYAEPYLAPDKPVWLVGLSFERDTRCFVEGVVVSVAVRQGTVRQP